MMGSDSSKQAAPMEERKQGAFDPEKVYMVGIHVSQGRDLNFDYPGEVLGRIGRLQVPNDLNVGAGFSPDWAPKPLRVKYPKSKRGRDRGVFDMGFVWLVTAKMKAELERIDPGTFDFAPAPIDQDIGMEFFYADVIRYVDALAKLNTNLAGEPTPCGGGLQFNANALEGVGFFRVPIYWIGVFCKGASLNLCDISILNGMWIDEAGVLV